MNSWREPRTLAEMSLRSAAVEDHRILGVFTLTDPVLRHIAPIGLAASHPACLLIDADPTSPGYPGAPHLAEMAERGLRRSELIPERRGVALLDARDLDSESLLERLTPFTRFWPAVVLRVPARIDQPVPCVPVIPLLPPPLDVPGNEPAVYQTCLRGGRTEAPGLSLPLLGRSRIRSLLAGVVEPRWSWVRAFRPAWSLPWR